MVNFLEFVMAMTAVCVAVTLYSVLRRRRRPAKTWGIAAAAGIVVCAALELYLRMG
jgi:hypothetical protein